MSGTLEDFVATLRAEGVEAGKREAERIRREAEARARAIVEEAEREAAAIVATAQAEARREREQAEAELRIAARDTLLSLRAALAEALERILVTAVERPLRDPEVVGDLIREAVHAYARADAGGGRFELRVPPEMEAALADWALPELARSLLGESAAVDARATLREAGFEYRVGQAGTVEVTTGAAAELLARLVSPRLAAIVSQIAAEEEGDDAPVPVAAGEAAGR